MIEPVSFFLFPPDLLPDGSSFVCAWSCRAEFLTELRQLQALRFSRAAYARDYSRIRVLLDVLGGLGGVW
jgi:hypothetical protein